MKLSRILSTLLRAEPPAMFTQAELDERFEQEQDKAYRQSDVEFLRAYRQGARDVLIARGLSDDAANAEADECVEGYEDAMSLLANDYR
jgi:hypothetical protein